MTQINTTITGIMLGFAIIGNAYANTDPSPLAAKLFSNTQGMPVPIQQMIADNLAQKGYMVVKDQITTEKCGIVKVKTEVNDINHDGKQEAVILIGNECTSGKIGATLYLFTQEADGSLQRHFGFSASDYQILPAKDDPWPAFLIKGTGDCQPIWRNKSGRYAFNSLYESKQGGCAVPQSGNHGG
jgi:hypothetical protein